MKLLGTASLLLVALFLSASAQQATRPNTPAHSDAPKKSASPAPLQKPAPAAVSAAFRDAANNAIEALDELKSSLTASRVVFEQASVHAAAKAKSAERAAAAESETGIASRLTRLAGDMTTCRTREDANWRALKLQHETKMIGKQGFARVDQEESNSIESAKVADAGRKKVKQCGDEAGAALDEIAAKVKPQ